MTPHITPADPADEPPDHQDSPGDEADGDSPDVECEGCESTCDRASSRLWRTLDRSTAERAVRLAELIVARAEMGVWRRSEFPTIDQMVTDLSAASADLCSAVSVLMWRRLLFPQHDPALGDRLLPAPDLAGRTAAVEVADRIAVRIKLGLWAGVDFPTIETISELFKSSFRTVSAAMQILKSEGLIHKVVVDTGVRGRGSRKQMWRPTDFPDQSVRDLVPPLREAINAGELGPVLPPKTEIAETYRVNNRVAADAYRRLQQEGIINTGWLPQGRKPVWYVVSADGPPEGVLPGEVRSIAVAARLISDLPEWLVTHRNGAWFRRPLPNQRELVNRYHVHAFDVERGQELLVRLNILERAPVIHRLYFPRPPADPTAAHGLSFRMIGKPPPRPWVPTRTTADWLPLPTSADDEHVRFVDALEPRLARKKNYTRPTNPT